VDINPFGITNALSTFIQHMNEVLKEFLGEFCIAYLDNILVFSKTLEDHLMHAQRFFEKLREEKFLINLNKCMFVKRELVYLGFFVLEKGLNIDLEKVKQIVEWPTPRSVTEVNIFSWFGKFL
jgi:hypothetical protein